jgi:hypothetical protein
MSYLNPLRLHFAGRFQANISTVNNDPNHFYNAVFKPSYQDLAGPGFHPPNGWFSPQGDAAWRLLGCVVTAAWTPAGAVPQSDPVLQSIVADSDGQVPAKLCDLDPEQQLVSEIWGLQVRIADGSGNTLLLSDYEPAAFIDIWDRAQGQAAGGDTDAGAMYQSVLTNLQWSDVSASPFLTQLKAAAADGLLSIKFNVDSVNLDNTSPDFLCGRIAGTIGPAAVSEPRHMVIGRQFMAAPYGGGNFFIPAGGINFCAGVVDPGAKCIFLDLGNAIGTTGAAGAMVDMGDLTLGVYDVSGGTPYLSGAVTPLGTIPAQGPNGYTNAEWYAATAGVVSIPLSAEQLQSIAGAPLVITSQTAAFISEWPTGGFVRADRFVYRLSPGDSVDIPVYVTQFGQPVADSTVSFAADPSQLQAQESTFLTQYAVPQVAVPESAISFNASARTNANGVATLTLKTSDPGTPRWFNDGKDYGIDGQVYGIQPALSPRQFGAGPVNQWNFISILLWSGFTASDPVTWNDVGDIFQQYANLYPVMNRFLNLGDYDSVVRHRGLLTLAFSLGTENPNSMPVTRDLSPTKRTAILSFLADPRRGAVTETAAAAAAVPAEMIQMAEMTATPPEMARRGGKAAAAGRRLIMHKGPRS